MTDSKGRHASSAGSQDLEAGDAPQSEKSLLLADRRTSSLDEEHSVSMSRAHSRTPPAKPKASLHVSSETTSSDQQGADQGKRLKGLGLAGIATVFQAVMSVCAKILGQSGVPVFGQAVLCFAGQSGVPVFEILLVRGVMVLSISYMRAVTTTQHTFPYALGKRKWLLVLRGCLGFGAVASLYWSLQYLPLSDALVLTFLSPLLVAALSPVFNKELPSLIVVVAMVISLGGVVMIAKPSFLFGGNGINKTGLVLALMQAVFGACARIVVRDLRRTETTDIIMVYSGTMHCICAVVACVTVPGSVVILQHTWQVVTLLLTGSCAYGAQVTLTSALRLVEASPATAMSYLTVVWGMVLGYFFFSEIPGLWELLGAAVVCSTTMLLGWDEKRQHDKQAQQPPQQEDNESEQDEDEPHGRS